MGRERERKAGGTKSEPLVFNPPGTDHAMPPNGKEGEQSGFSVPKREEPAFPFLPFCPQRDNLDSNTDFQ